MTAPTAKRAINDHQITSATDRFRHGLFLIDKRAACLSGGYRVAQLYCKLHCSLTSAPPRLITVGR